MAAPPPADIAMLAFHAGAIGLAAAAALGRDALERRPPGSGRESLVATLAVAALVAALAAGAGSRLRLLAGALALTGLVLMAAAPRDPARPSPARRIGALCAAAGIAVALAASFLPAAAGSEQSP